MRKLRNEEMETLVRAEPPDPTRKGLGKNLARKCLERWNIMPPSVLMRERTSPQPTSVRVRLMTGSEYTAEHRNFENWSNT